MCVSVITKRTRIRAFANRVHARVRACICYRFFLSPSSHIFYLRFHIEIVFSERHTPTKTNCNTLLTNEWIFCLLSFLCAMYIDSLRYEPLFSIVFHIFAFHLQSIRILIFIRFLFFCHFWMAVDGCFSDFWLLLLLFVAVFHFSFYHSSHTWFLLLLYFAASTQIFGQIIHTIHTTAIYQFGLGCVLVAVFWVTFRLK